MHIKLSVTAMSDDRTISAIIINISLKESLRITKGRTCCLVQKQTF